MLWTFHLVVLLIFLYLLQFFFHQLCHVDCQKNESCSTNQKSLFFYLLFFLVFLYFQSDLDLRETEFNLTIFMLASSSLLIYLCFFVHETSLELLITYFSYLFLNIIIGAVIADIEVFFRCTMLYVTIQSFIGMILYLVSLLTNESLTCIFNKVKLKILISQLVFLSMTLNSINFHYFWVSLWLKTFTFQLIVFHIYSFLITKNPGLQTLERKETTFLSRFVLYSCATFIFLMNPPTAVILMINPFFIKSLLALIKTVGKLRSALGCLFVFLFLGFFLIFYLRRNIDYI